MPATAIAWLRRDLRLHDHPALAAAAREAERVVPVFVVDRRLLDGRFPSLPRAWFLLRSLHELRAALRAQGADLVVREGLPERVLPALAAEVGASAVHHAGDVSPFATARDRRVAAALEAAGVGVRVHPGVLACDDVGPLRDRDGEPFTVFSRFWRAWRELPRRPVLPPPRLRLPEGVDPGPLPAPPDPGLREPLAPGEAAARARMAAWLADGVEGYGAGRARLDVASSQLSPHLHFGTLSARELEARAADRGSPGARAFARQLAWRDFYAHVLLHHPANARMAFQPALRELRLDGGEAAFAAWAQGRTGYPVVDAGIRQLRACGWMHNRARLLTASFLVKDLHVDWRRGEAFFMRWLLCGDEAQNNGNWQWVSSVGVDPAPYYRRLYNPVLQQRRHDPDGAYVRRWVPELARVPLERLAEPWKMPRAEQEAYGCVVGRDYPAPIVDHGREREEAAARYRELL